MTHRLHVRGANRLGITQSYVNRIGQLVFKYTSSWSVEKDSTDVILLNDLFPLITFEDEKNYCLFRGTIRSDVILLIEQILGYGSDFSIFLPIKNIY